MNIPSYATCSMCQAWEDDKCLSNQGTCRVATEAAVEGLIQAGYPKPENIKVVLAWDAKPCPEWEPSAEGEREIALAEAEANARVEPLPMDSLQARNMEAGRRPGGGI